MTQKCVSKLAIKKYNEEYGKKPLQYKKSARKKVKTMGYLPTLYDVKGLPKFHSKKQGNFSYTTNQTNGNIKISQENSTFYLHIPNFKKELKSSFTETFLWTGSLRKLPSNEKEINTSFLYPLITSVQNRTIKRKT